MIGPKRNCFYQNALLEGIIACQARYSCPQATAECVKQNNIDLLVHHSERSFACCYTTTV